MTEADIKRRRAIFDILLSIVAGIFLLYIASSDYFDKRDPFITLVFIFTYIYTGWRLPTQLAEKLFPFPSGE